MNLILPCGKTRNDTMVKIYLKFTKRINSMEIQYVVTNRFLINMVYETDLPIRDRPLVIYVRMYAYILSISNVQKIH